MEATYHRIIKERTGKETQERIVFASAAQGAEGFRHDRQTTLLLLMSAAVPQRNCDPACGRCQPQSSNPPTA
ncbi:MAG: hypothetical protein ACR2NN_21215 [Bryobacteraceae bacterium]